MPFAPQREFLIYLITNGQTTPATTPASNEFAAILKLVRSAVAAQIDIVQIREKKLNVSVLYELARAASAITAGTETKLLINDRADVAASAGAAGVHLTASSLGAGVIREAFGSEFVIGVSTHSTAEAVAAELVKSFRIAQPRLRTAGVGLLAPVGSNATDSGRALNRRVELVAP